MWSVWGFYCLVGLWLVAVFSIHLFHCILVYIKIRTEIEEGSLCSVEKVAVKELTSKNLSKTCLYHVQLKMQCLSC